MTQNSKTLSQIEERILSHVREQQERGFPGVTENRLYMKFDNGQVWGRGYEGVIYWADRLVKKGLLIKVADRYTASEGGR